jgi:hypothetical protein
VASALPLITKPTALQVSGQTRLASLDVANGGFPNAAAAWGYCRRSAELSGSRV